MRSTLTFAIIDHGFHDHAIHLKLLRATGAAKDLAVPAELRLPAPDNDSVDSLDDARSALIRHFAHLPTDRALAVMLTHEPSIQHIEKMSDFAITALNPAADRKLADYCELSEDGQEIAFEIQGANSPIVVILGEDKATAYAVRTQPRIRNFVDVVPFGKLDFVPLYLTIEATFRVPALLFAKTKVHILTAEDNTQIYYARDDLARWFWGPAQDQIEDPIVSSSHRQAMETKQGGELTYAAGTEAEMRRLLQWAIDINAFTKDSEFARRAYEPAFARVEITSAGAHGPAQIKPLNVAPRIQRVMMEIVAAFGPRGQKKASYETNRLSSVVMGGVKKSFGVDCEVESAHELLEAIAGLTTFLERRGYLRREIDELLNVTSDTN